MSDDLFRREALAHRQQAPFGDVFLVRPATFRIYATFAVAVAVALVLYLWLGEYARRETVPGYLVPDQGLVRVQAPRPGIVADLRVHDAELVSEGDVLAVVSTHRSTLAAGDVEARQIEQLEQRRSALKEQLEGADAVGELKVKETGNRIESLKDEIELLDERLATMRERLRRGRHTVDRFRRLNESGALPDHRLDEKIDRQLNRKGRVQALRRERASLVGELDRLRERLPRLRIEARMRRSELRAQLADTRRQLTELQAQRDYTIRAPVNGQVTSLQAEEGQRVEHRTVLAIVPEEAEFQAKLMVPSRAIGFIESGHSVKLRYRAFPHERYGLQKGVVTAISDAILSPDQIQAPVRTQKPVYRVTADLRRQTVHAYGRDHSLKSGMLLEADIVLERRPIYEWLLEPLYSITGRM